MKKRLVSIKRIFKLICITIKSKSLHIENNTLYYNTHLICSLKKEDKIDDFIFLVEFIKSLSMGPLGTRVPLPLDDIINIIFIRDFIWDNINNLYYESLFQNIEIEEIEFYRYRNIIMKSRYMPDNIYYCTLETVDDLDKCICLNKKYNNTIDKDLLFDDGFILILKAYNELFMIMKDVEKAKKIQEIEELTKKTIFRKERVDKLKEVVTLNLDNE